MNRPWRQYTVSHFDAQQEQEITIEVIADGYETALEQSGLPLIAGLVIAPGPTLEECR